MAMSATTMDFVDEGGVAIEGDVRVNYVREKDAVRARERMRESMYWVFACGCEVC